MIRSVTVTGPMLVAALGWAPSVCAASGSGLVSTVAGGGSATVPNLATNISLNFPQTLAVDASGNLYIGDTNNYRILRVDAVSGMATLVAGSGQSIYSGDGGPATQAGMGKPRAIAVDSGLNVYFSDTSNNRVRRVDSQTGIITTIAGTGTASSSGDGSPASVASLNGPFGLAFDTSGNLFVTEQSGNRVRRIDAATGIITTAAGTGGGGPLGDGGPAIYATLNQPIAVAFDSGGNLFISDFFNLRIRRVDAASGIITTFAGTGSSYFTGDGTAAASTGISYPGQVAFDSSGNLYFGSPAVERVLKIDAVTNLVSTIAGTGYGASSPDGMPATATSITFPAWIAITPQGNLLTVDAYANKVRSISLPSPYAYSVIFLAASGNGQPETLTVSVAALGGAGTPTGTVQFYDSYTTLVGSAQLVNGSATLQTTSLAPGSHSLAASYSGDGAFNPSTSVPVAIDLTAVTKTQTGVTFTSNYNPAPVGATITLSATIAPRSDQYGNWATGTITLMNGSTSMGTFSVSEGLGSTSLWVAQPETLALTAVYSGDANFAGSTSAVLNQVIEQDPKLSVSGTPNPSTVGGTVTLTAFGNPAATGTITFLDQLTSATLGSAPLANGSASISTTALIAGQHTIMVSYPGDANFAPVKVYLNQTVKSAPVTSIASSATTITYGQTVTLTASVTPTAATGTVQFLDGGTSLGSATLSGGTAALAVSTLNAGNHSITASYSGDSVYGSSASAVIAETVNPAASTVSLSSSQSPAPSGQAITLTAAVSPSAAGGNVQFLDGATVLATVALANGSAAYNATLGIGSHSLTAVYVASGNYAGSTSAAFNQLITTTTTTTLGANPAPSTYGQAVQLTASVLSNK